MQTERDRNEVLSSFLDIGVQLTQNLGIDQVLLTIVQRSMELTGARYGAALTVDQSGGIGKFLHRGMMPEQVDQLPHPPEGRGLLGFVMSEKAPVRVDDIAEHPASVGFPYSHVPMRAFLGVPLLHREELVGSLYLTKEPSQEPFSPDDEELVTALGAFAAVGILNSRLFDSEAERARRSTVLQSIASRARRSLDTSQVLAAAVEEMGRAAGVQRCFVRLGSDARSLGPIEHEWLAAGFPGLKGGSDRHYAVTSLVAVTGMTAWTNDILSDPRFDETETGPLIEARAKAVLAAPLKWGEELLGVAVFHSESARDWTEADIELIESAADEVATALHHADLYHRAVATADELARLDEVRRDFMSMVSHELRSPMTVVAGISDLLQKRSDDLSPQDRRDLIDTLGRESRRLTKLVSEVLDVESIDQGLVSLIPRELDLAEVVRESVTDAGRADRTDVVMEPGETRVVADRDRVKQIMINLLSNAIKFSPEDEPIVVSVSPETDSVCVSVSDSGPGMSEEEVSRLFQRFTRIPRTGGSKPGSGLGLYLSKALVEKHGGRIWVDTKPGAGATFSFRLPRVAKTG